MPDDQLDILVAYLRQHGDRFVIDALRRQMLSEGHDAALVEEAIRIYQAEKPAPPPRPYWPLALGIAFLNLAGCIAGFGSMAAFNVSDRVMASLASLLLISLALEPVAGVVLIMAGGPLRRIGMGLLLGSVFFFSGILLLAGGFCLFFLAMEYS